MRRLPWFYDLTGIDRMIRLIALCDGVTQPWIKPLQIFAFVLSMSVWRFYL